VDWRSANGPFQSPADIQKVKGISPSVYEAIKDLVTVE
jgi:DNA uptake protein ComE-like DNA-binding protein